MEDGWGCRVNKHDIKLSTDAVMAFGSWSKACEAAGFKPNPSTHRTDFNKDVLRELLLQFYVLNGRLPLGRDFSSGSLPARTTYVRHFGGVFEAFEYAGLGLVAGKSKAA